jgi:hypothetical protein
MYYKLLYQLITSTCTCFAFCEESFTNVGTLPLAAKGYNFLPVLYLTLTMALKILLPADGCCDTGPLF